MMIHDDDDDDDWRGSHRSRCLPLKRFEAQASGWPSTRDANRQVLFLLRRIPPDGVPLVMVPLLLLEHWVFSEMRFR